MLLFPPCLAETCLQLKPLLHDPSLLSTPSSKASASLLALLRNLASTASDLSALLQQGRESLNPRDQDELDAEGVGIWNRSAEFRERGLGELFARGASRSSPLHAPFLARRADDQPPFAHLVRQLERPHTR